MQRDVYNVHKYIKIGKVPQLHLRNVTKLTNIKTLLRVDAENMMFYEDIIIKQKTELSKNFKSYS